MLKTNLRQKFNAAIMVLIAVSVIVLWGNRMLGKAALFHYLERQHLALVSEMETALLRLEYGVIDGQEVRSTLLQRVDAGQALAARADSELFKVEQLLFRLAGF